jgi:CRP/FNR family cyclic AMP-dependent transcriptional regulator
VQKGTAKLSALSAAGKEATVTFVQPGEFLGEEAAAAETCLRTCTGTAVTACTALRIERQELIRVIHDEDVFMDTFVEFLLARCKRRQEDVIALLLTSSEKRLVRLLLLMTDYGVKGETVVLLPKITQVVLAEMVGTTRSRVSFFMNKFRSLGLIECGFRIRVHRSLMSAVLEREDETSRPVPASIARPIRESLVKSYDFHRE